MRNGVRLFVSVVLVVSAGASASGCGKSSEVAAVAGPAGSAPRASTTSATPITSAPAPKPDARERLLALQNYFTNAQISQMYDQSRMSYQRQAAAPNTDGLVTGVIVSVTKSETRTFELFADKIGMPEADLAAVGANFVIAIDGSASRPDAKTKPTAGATITIQFPIWVGQRSSANNGDADAAFYRLMQMSPAGLYLATLLSTMPVFADGSRIVDAEAMILSDGPDGAAVPADIAMSDEMKGRTVSEVANTAKAEVAKER